MKRMMAVLALPLMLGACESWLTDFKQQPSVGTWQKFPGDSLAGETTPFRGNPQGSVPVTGTTVAAWQVSYTAGIAQLDSMAGIGNPVAADQRSLENGRKQYQVNCAVCHGSAGDVNTPLKQVNPVMGSVVPPLATGASLALTDGYIWGIMRNGRGLMASYNRIPEMERWDVVNYIRGLQGRYQVAVGPLGFPGQTGTALPGASITGPTMPSAFAKPSMSGLTPRQPKAEGSTGGHE